MIPLQLQAEVSGPVAEFVCRVSNAPDDPRDVSWGDDGQLHGSDNIRIRLAPGFAGGLVGDVLLVRPAVGLVRRLIRADSVSNFLLVTEQCDQLCVMCSQPPKTSHHDRFALLQLAALLAPPSCRLIVTGGEPTLHKEALFRFIARSNERRPDLQFHILSNGQHLSTDDRAFLRSAAGKATSWGIPLYASDPAVHDELVGKVGAFDQLLDGLALLCTSGSTVELRTVVLASNAAQLPRLAHFIAANVPFASPWAIMQLERAGFARNRWPALFFDNSQSFDCIGEALDIARASGVPVRLYNFPLCTVPAAYRRFAASSISDWKRKYLASCENCSVKSHCGGFFEWYQQRDGYKHLGFA